MTRFAAAALALAAAASGEPPPLTPEGWGPVRIGMTRAEVSDALGARLTGEALDDPDLCIEGCA